MSSRSSRHRKSQAEYNKCLSQFFNAQAFTNLETTQTAIDISAGADGCINYDSSLKHLDKNLSRESSTQLYDIVDGDSELDIDNCFNNDTNVDVDSDYLLWDEFICEDIAHDADCNNKGVSHDRTLADDLYTFFMLFNLGNEVMQFLLNILIKHNVAVPKSIYLLKQGHKTEMHESWICGNGKVAYYSLSQCLQFLIINKFVTAGQYLDMQFNVDGVPLFRNSSISLWPLLMRITNCTYQSAMPVAFYLGKNKPHCPSFLSKFADELSKIKTDGFIYKGCQLTVNSVIFICDAPARSMLQCIKSFSGYFGCGYCRQVGEYCKDRVIFPETETEPRTDMGYTNITENNQITRSVLYNIVPLKTGFPPEYMHSVCLGIMRKLLHYYCSPSKGLRLPCKLSTNQLNILSLNITSFSTYLPVEFHRKLRPISDLEHYKASELRTLLLYAGPVIFKECLQTDYYKHFILIHYITYSLCSSRHLELLNICKSLIITFITQMEVLFGKQSLVYNVHTLVHLPEFVELYGCLDNFSAFVFENFLYQIKKRIKVTLHIFEHVAKKMSIIPLLMGKHDEHILSFSNESPNNCGVTKNGDVILIGHFLQKGMHF